MSKVPKKDDITLADRFAYGNLRIDELCALKPCSRSKFYKDLHGGLLEIRKLGQRTLVPGPIARKYLSGG